MAKLSFHSNGAVENVHQLHKSRNRYKILAGVTSLIAFLLFGILMVGRH